LTEREVHWPYKPGYDLETDNIRLEMYRLLNQFLAEDTLSSLMENDDWLVHAMDIVGHLFTAECQRILIQASVVARIKDDNEEESRLKIGAFETTCGTLVSDISRPYESSPLCLREACNKIIHALRFHYDIETIHGREIIRPTVYLYGVRGKKEWKVTLNIIDFIKHFINNVT